MMITLAVDNGRQGKVDQLGLECVVGVTLTFERSEVSLTDLIYASSLYVGTDTALGPAALGFGITDFGDRSFYLFVGKNF